MILSTLTGKCRREHHYWGKVHERCHKSGSGREGQVLSHLEANRQIETPAQVKGLCDIGNREAFCPEEEDPARRLAVNSLYIFDSLCGEFR